MKHTMDDKTGFEAESHWSVRVECEGEEVVTIESNCLSGRDLTKADEDLIRNCAHHLLSFIGNPIGPILRTTVHHFPENGDGNKN